MASTPKLSKPSATLKKMMKATSAGKVITPRLYQYLATRPDNSSLIDTSLILTLLRLAKEKKATRSGAFHPSQLWECPRAQVFSYLGVPPKTTQWTPEQINLFNDGTWRHIRWQVTLMKAGILTHVEVPVHVPGYRFMGSIDGTNEPESWMLELKGTSLFDDVKTYGAMPKHRKQVHGYFIGRPDIERAAILYEDKSSNHWHEEIVHPERRIIAQLEGILHDLNEAVEHQTLPQVLEECEHGEGAYRQCSFAYLCKQVDFAKAEAAAGCADQEEVYVKLGVKRRNSHKPKSDSTRRKAKGGLNEVGTAVTVRAKGGTLRVRRGIDGPE